MCSLLRDMLEKAGKEYMELPEADSESEAEDVTVLLYLMDVGLINIEITCKCVQFRKPWSYQLCATSGVFVHGSY